MEQTAILITGAAHSGTRLLTRMLGTHSDISLPSEILNYVGEFYPWHTYFVNTMDKTPLHSENYNFDFEEMKFILDSYMAHIDKKKPYFIIKMPYYPLNCLDFLIEYFENRIYILYSERKKEKIIKSFENRAEDILYFSDTNSHIRQIKKLNLQLRKEYISKPIAKEIFSHIIDETLRKKETWNKNNDNFNIIDVDIENLAKSQTYFENLLKKIKIEPKNTEDSYKVLDKKRLSVNFLVKIKYFIKRKVYKIKYKYL